MHVCDIAINLHHFVESVSVVISAQCQFYLYPPCLPFTALEELPHGLHIHLAEGLQSWESSADIVKPLEYKLFFFFLFCFCFLLFFFCCCRFLFLLVCFCFFGEADKWEGDDLF